MLILSLEVKRGAKVLKPATILTVTHEDSFGSLLERISSGFQDEAVEVFVAFLYMNFIMIFICFNNDIHRVFINYKPAYRPCF